MSNSSSNSRFSVGYALPTKKMETFIQPSLIRHAKQRGIDLILIDRNRPLIQQGPFHCIIHKLFSDDWKEQLQQFMSTNPDVIIIDPPGAIEPLRYRVSMLQVVQGLEIEETIPHDDDAGIRFGIPKQAVVNHYIESLSGLGKPELKFPVIAKSFVAEGSATAHDMLLVFNDQGLKKVKPPAVLQEFVNHGGVVFKVYVAGGHVECVKRRSLPDVSSEANGLEGEEGALFFSQISNLNSYKGNDGRLRLGAAGGVNVDEGATLPPSSFVNGIARALQRKLRLHLFNFDMIRDASPDGKERYLVIDINYFPGFAKLPGFENILTDFFWDVLHANSDY